MPPDLLPQLIDALLRLSSLQPAEVKELIEGLPDPQASAQEMLRRGWITQSQFSSLFPGPEDKPPARETLLVGCGENDVPDADGDNWDLAIPEENAEGESEIESPRPEMASTAPCDPVVAPQPFEWDMAPATLGNKLRARESETDKRMRQLTRWAGKGLLIWLLFLGSFCLGTRFFTVTRPRPSPKPAALKESNPQKLALKESKKRRVPADNRQDIGHTPVGDEFANPQAADTMPQHTNPQTAEARISKVQPADDNAAARINDSLPPIPRDLVPPTQPWEPPLPDLAQPSPPVTLMPLPSRSPGVTRISPRGGLPVRTQTTNTFPAQSSRAAGLVRITPSHAPTPSGHRIGSR